MAINFIELEKVHDQDLKLNRLIEDRENGPREITALEKELAAEREKMAIEKQKLEKLQVDESKKQSQLDEETQMMKKKQDRIGEIKNQKEYQANIREIEASRMEMSILEEDLKLIREKTMKQQEVFEEAKKQFETYEGDVAEKRVEIEKRLSTLESEYNGIKKNRDELAKNVDPSILSLYDRVRRRTKGPALLKVSQPSCPNCFMSISPQRFNEVIKMQSLVTCESCQLMFLWKDPSGNE